METVEPKNVTDDDIVSFLREVALEGYDTDADIVQEVTWALQREHPGQPDLAGRVERLASPLFDGLHAAEAGWPIPTDNDRLDRAFEALRQDGIHALQNWYGSQEPADEEMRHELKFAKPAQSTGRKVAVLGGTGNERGDRHPKIGRGVMMGAGAKILGNIKVGDCARVAAGSVVLNAKAPMVMEGNYKPGFRIELHMKDLQNALDTAHEMGVPVPLTSQVMEMMQALKVDGKQAQDHGGLIQFFEKLAGVKVRRGGAK